MFRHTIPAGAALAAILVTVGCSSPSNDPNDTADDPTSSNGTSLEGKAADGYLAGARVCLDLNSNNACDDGEPSTTTANGGSYSLEGVTQEQIDNSPIVVEIIVGETIDEDEPGVAIEKKYTLTAPAGSAFVSPLTTMVQNEIKEKGLTPDEAKASVQNKLGTDLDPTEDYVAGSDDETDNAEFERLHKVAQVTRAVMQKNIELVEIVVGETGISMEDLTALIIDQVINALDDIQQAVEMSGENFNADDLAASEELGGTRLDPTTVEDELQARDDRKNAVTANLSTLLTSGGGLNFFDSDEDEGVTMYSYGNVQADSEGNITITQYNFDEESWLENEDGNSQDQNCILANATWNCLAENEETISTDGDNVRILKGGLTAAEELISGVEIDLVGKRVVTYLDQPYHDVIDPTAIFATGATGYQLTFTRTNDIFEVYKDNVEDASQCWGGEFNEGNTWAPTDVWCNNVFVHTGDGNHETDGDAATSLSQLISTSAASNPTSRTDIAGVDIYGNDNEQWAVELVEGGSANIYEIEYDDGSESIDNIATGSWTQTTTDTKAIIALDLPAKVALRSGHSEGQVQIYTVIDGYVRQGEMMPAGARGDRQWVFDGAARDQIKNAFDVSLQESLVACDIADNEDSAVSDFIDAATVCSAVSFITDDIVGKAFALHDGAFSFTAEGNGLYQGEVGDDDYASLEFTWVIDGDGYIEINTQRTEDGATEYLRMNMAKIESNARQISVVTLGQDSEDSSTLDTSTGEVNSEVWDIR